MIRDPLPINLTEPEGRGPARDGGELSGLHELLEAAEVGADLVLGGLAEEPGEPGAEPAPGGVDLEVDADLGPAAARRPAEVDRAGGLDRRALDRPPG